MKRRQRASLTIAILAVGLLAGSAVGVATQNALVTGTITPADVCEPAPDGASLCSGGRFEFDDPRLTGDFEETTTMAFGSGEDFAEGFIATEDIRLTNDGGAWSGRSLWAFVLSADPIFVGSHWVLTGEDGYEGLTAYVGEDTEVGLEGEAVTVRGFILESEPIEPPAE